MATFGAAISMRDNFSNQLTKLSSGLDGVVKNFNGTAIAAQRASLQTESFGDRAIEKITKLGAAWLGLRTAQGGMDFSDGYAQTNARLGLMNDGLRTTDELQNSIYDSAMRSRSLYQDQAAIVGKLGILAGHAFKNNDEQIFFAEQMNKQFKIGGASIQEQQSAMYQLTQAMASGRLQGDEFRSIMENAPLLAQSLAKHFGKSIGELKEMSSQGAITANDIKFALFKAADETNERFKNLPVTFAEGWIMFKNIAFKYLTPVWQAMGSVANGEAMARGLQAIVPVIQKAAWLISGTIYNIVYLGQMIASNWGLIAPIVGAALALMAFHLGIATLATTRLAVATALKTVASWAETAAIFAMIVAQNGLNAALLACPLTWIVYAIIAVVAIIYLAVAAFNKLAGTSLSATGIIMGAFYVMGAVIYNQFASLANFIYNVFIVGSWNAFAMFANFLGNVFNNPIGAIQKLFFDLGDYVLNILQSIARAIDNVFGSSLAGAVQGWRDTLSQKALSVVPNQKEFVKKMGNQDILARIDVAGAWDKGYQFGDGLSNALSLADFKNPQENAFDSMATSGDETAKNTKGMKNALDISSEDLKYLKEAAEREVINRFGLAEIKIDMTNHNNISNEMDLDGIVDSVNVKLNEAMQTIAEEVHK